MKTNKGFSLIELMVVIVILGFLALIINPQIVQADSEWYSVTGSTVVLGQGGDSTADPVNISGRCDVKHIVIYQTGVIANTVSFYKNWTSTPAATLVATVYIPGTVGIYYPLGENIISTTGGNNDIIKMKNFAVRAAPDSVGVASDTVKITVLYGD